MDLRKMFGQRKNSFLELTSLAKAMYLPMTKKEKADYRDRIKKLIETYKPKIEDKTNNNIGGIRVESYLKEGNSLFWRMNRRTIKEALKKEENPNILQKGLANIVISATNSTIYPLFFLWIAYRNSVISLGAIEDCITVPTGIESRLELWREKCLGKDLKLDQKIVHELSHILWEKIAKKEDIKLKDTITYKKWIEGFATFCEQEYFSDIYPKNYEIMKDPKEYGSSYSIGKEKVKQTIERCGQETILQIPNRWKEFEIEIASEVSEKC